MPRRLQPLRFARPASRLPPLRCAHLPPSPTSCRPDASDSRRHLPMPPSPATTSRRHLPAPPPPAFRPQRLHLPATLPPVTFSPCRLHPLATPPPGPFRPCRLHLPATPPPAPFRPCRLHIPSPSPPASRRHLPPLPASLLQLSRPRRLLSPASRRLARWSFVAARRSSSPASTTITAPPLRSPHRHLEARSSPLLRSLRPRPQVSSSPEGGELQGAFPPSDQGRGCYLLRRHGQAHPPLHHNLSWRRRRRCQCHGHVARAYLLMSWCVDGHRIHHEGHATEDPSRSGWPHRMQFQFMIRFMTVGPPAVTCPVCTTKAQSKQFDGHCRILPSSGSHPCRFVQGRQKFEVAPDSLLMGPTGAACSAASSPPGPFELHVHNLSVLVRLQPQVIQIPATTKRQLLLWRWTGESAIIWVSGLSFLSICQPDQDHTSVVRLLLHRWLF